MFCVDAYARTSDVQVRYVVDSRLSPGAFLTDDTVRVEVDIQAVLDDPSVEAIHLATPPFVREEIVLPVLRAGKSVLCEKPLALSLEAADAMIEAAEQTGTTLRTNYVLRHHPAFDLVERLARSDLLGQVRTISLLNFAQALPPDHWMWDESRSGGILVEHGVHFFDAYGRLVSRPEAIEASVPKPHAIDATVRYSDGAIGRYYHEFAFPSVVERTTGIVMFERGWVEISGWIPHCVRVLGVTDMSGIEEDLAMLDVGGTAGIQREPNGFSVDYGDRQEAYRGGIVAGMRDVVARHRESGHATVVTNGATRESLALALDGRQSARSGKMVRCIHGASERRTTPHA